MQVEEMIFAVTRTICDKDQGCYLWKDEAQAIASKLLAGEELHRAATWCWNTHGTPTAAHHLNELKVAFKAYEKAGADING